MKEEQKKKNKIIGLSLGILIVLLLVVAGTYAYWQLTKEQTDSNAIIAKCLDLELTNETGTFGLSSAWPITDSEGATLPGYTFDVVNNCDEDIAYIIGMDSIAEEGDLEYLQNSSVKISLDETPARLFSELSNIDHMTSDELTIRESKEIYTATVLGHKSNTHNVKAWIKEDAPVEEINKVFSGRVFITGGQFITDDNPIPEEVVGSCFEIDENGEITGYNKNCGTSVTIPDEVDGVQVKSISSNAFKDKDTNDLLISELDLSEADHLEVIKGTAFSRVAGEPVISDGCEMFASTERETVVPAGLTKLTFGTNPNLEIGMNAFAGLNVDELTVYTTLKGYSECRMNAQSFQLTHDENDLAISVPFAHSNIGTLNIKSNGSSTAFDTNIMYDGLFLYSTVGTINVHEGVTALDELCFIDTNVVNLPSTLQTIKKVALRKTVLPSITIPSSVTLIEEYAFLSWPNTSTINLDFTQAEAATKTLESGWSGDAIVNYKAS